MSGGGAPCLSGRISCLFPHHVFHLRQQAGDIQMLRALGQAFAATHARRGRISALYRRHGHGVVSHCPLLVAVQQIVVVDVGEDVADGDVLRAGNALVASGTVDVARWRR